MNQFEKRSMQSYDKKAADYENTPEGRYTASFRAMLCSRVVPPKNGNVLDVACGNGQMLRSLSEKHTITGYGVDISKSMVEVAQKKNPSLTFTATRCEELPFTENFFDVITVSAAFHHFPNPQAFAVEAARVIKPGGLLYLAEVYYPKFIRLICNPFVPLSRAGDVKFYAPEEIKEIFERQSFSQQALELNGHMQLHIFRMTDMSEQQK